MSNLVPQPEGALTPPTAARLTPQNVAARSGLASGVDPRNQSWGRPRLDAQTYGLIFPPATSPELASGISRDTTVRRRGQTLHRRVVAWRACADSIVVLATEQQLRPRSDGKLEPVGAWTVQPMQVFTPLESPKTRTGEVADDSGPGGLAASPTTSIEQDQPENRRFVDAIREYHYLPATVRKSILARANPPLVFQAETLRHSSDSGSMYYTTAVLRLNENEAVVVQAARQHALPTWQVTQYHYTFAAKPQELGYDTGSHRAALNSRRTSP